MSAVAGARFVHEAGAEPTLQIVPRPQPAGDHGRPARRMVARRATSSSWGDPMHAGDHPDATPVFDLAPNDVIRLARRIRDEGTTGAGAEIADPPRYLIGVADVPLADPYDPARLEAKLDAGGDVVWTQIVYDTDRLAGWAELLGHEGVRTASIVVGLVPLRSVANARFLDGLYGVHVPRGVRPAGAGGRRCGGGGARVHGGGGTSDPGDRRGVGDPSDGDRPGRPGSHRRRGSRSLPAPDRLVTAGRGCRTTVGRTVRRGPRSGPRLGVRPDVAGTGRITLLSAYCSRTCAVHPAIQAAANTGVIRSVGTPRTWKTTAA